MLNRIIDFLIKCGIVYELPAENPALIDSGANDRMN